MLPIIGRLFRNSGDDAESVAARKPKAGALQYVLGMKWTVNSRVELAELAGLEQMLRSMDLPGIEFDKVESGFKDISYWFYVDNPKRAFKALTALPELSRRMQSLQAASAERSLTKMKFSIVYPK